MRPWRDAYRQYDPSFFRGELCEIPELRPRENTLDHSILSSSRAERALLHPLDRTLDSLVAPLSQGSKGGLLQIPDLDSLDGAEQQVPWCSDFQWRAPRSKQTTGNVDSANQIAPEATARAKSASDSTSIRKTLVALLSGYESESFEWNSLKRVFVYRDPELQIPGISGVASRALFRPCVERGTYVKRLELAQEYLTRYESHFSPTFIQVKVLLREFLDYCQESFPAALREDETGSLMSIPHWAEPTTDALRWLCTVLNLEDETFELEKTLTKLTVTHLFDQVEQEVRNQIGITTIRDQVSRELLDRIAKPLMQEISSITGLGPRNFTEREFFTISSKDKDQIKAKDDDVYHRTPKMLEDAQIKTIVEVERGVKFLELYSDSKIDGTLKTMQSLKLEFTSFRDTLDALERRVNEWSESFKGVMREAVPEGFPQVQQQERKDLVPQPLHQVLTKEAILTGVRDSMMNLNALEAPRESSRLERALNRHKSSTSSFNLTQCMRVCLTLPLQIQASLVHSEVLNILMHKMNLRNHLDLLSQVYLMSNGTFSSRLSDMIFSSHNGGSSIGLNTTNPKAPGWPPSSAKVSVATRSLLIDSIDAPYYIESSHALGERNLLGNLGILMSLEEEEERQPDISRQSLDALSFLRFGFRAPKPLDMIITDRSLTYYSKINQFLLILLRMMNAVEQMTLHAREYRTMRRLSNVSERFRIEASHFVRSFVSHIYETVIATHYRTFEIVLGKNDTGIDVLRDAHQVMLEHICHGCFISHKMKDLNTLIRRIFESILSFTSTIMRNENHETLEKLYRMFHGDAKKVVAVLAGADSSGSFATSGGASVRFLMTDFWSL